jgi:hypothetical protein
VQFFQSMPTSGSYCVARLIPTIALALAACHQSPVSVDASKLEVRATITAPVITASAPQGRDTTQVTVSVTNPRWRPVVVQLGGPPYTSGNMPAAKTHGVGFGVRVVSVDSGPPRGPSQWSWGQPAIRLGARQTLHYTVTLGTTGTESKPGSGLMGITPGHYRVIASFGKQEAAPLDLRVSP